MFSQLSATFVQVAQQFGLTAHAVPVNDPAVQSTAASPYVGHGAGLYGGSLPSIPYPGSGATGTRL